MGKRYKIYKDLDENGVSWTVYEGISLVGQFLGDEPEFEDILATNDFTIGTCDWREGKKDG
jgi:hypothetical protein